jgi:hypothetical protein
MATMKPLLPPLLTVLILLLAAPLGAGELALPPGNPDYEIKIGPPVSLEDPALRDWNQHLPPGEVGAAFRLIPAGDFTITRIETTLSEVKGRSLEELTRSEAELPPGSDVFQKCWSVPWAGHFLITVKHAHDGSVLATEQFWLSDGASKTRAMKQALGSYNLWFGPSTSVETPQPLRNQPTVSAAAGGMMSMQLEAPEGGRFARDHLEISLYRFDSNGRTLETRSLSAVGLDNDRFYKSWHMSVAGRFEVQVVDPKGPRLIAQGEFEITP